MSNAPLPPPLAHPEAGPPPGNAPPIPPELGAPREESHTQEAGAEGARDGAIAATLVALPAWLETAPAWLASALLHLGILLIAALLAIGASPEATLSLSASFSDEIGEQLDEEMLDLAANLDIEIEEAVLTPTDLVPVDDPIATPPELAITPDGPSFSAELVSVTPGAALSGREIGMKEALLKAFGGTEATEAAVLDGLKWLKRQQQNDGGWSLKGPYKGGIGTTDNREAATAMALLAFQGAGHLPRNGGQFGREVYRGWRWLLGRQLDDGSFFQTGTSIARFYTNAQCTIALCELYAMTKDSTYRSAAERAVAYLVATQGEAGGWRYKPARDSDLSVTGWVLMALKSARMAGIEVPKKTFDDTERFLSTVQKDDRQNYGDLGSRYVYEPDDFFIHDAMPVMTSVGLLCRQYMGWKSKDRRIQQGVKHLLKHLPEWRPGKINVYYWYYATQVCHHAGGPGWTAWNGVMRELLPANQVKRGPERGSWDPSEDEWGDREGGRLYMTCLSIYTLEVYYRHLPLYQQEAVQEGP